MPTWIVFGERNEGDRGGRGRTASRIDRDYGILVDEAFDDVAKSLEVPGMRQFTRRWEGDPVSVYVNPSSVLYIEDHPTE